MLVDIGLWVIIYSAPSNLPTPGAWTFLGVAFWLTLAALLALFVAVFPWQFVVLVFATACFCFVWILIKLVEIVWRSQPDWGVILEAEARLFMREFF